MATNYPSSLQTFTNPAGTSLLSSPSHATQHITENDTLVAIQTTLGTTAGTSVLKDFVAGQFPARINNGGTLVQIITGGTANALQIGTPQITGGTITNSLISGGSVSNVQISSPSITGGTMTSQVINNPIIGTPGISSGTITGAIISNATIGTPSLSSGTITGAVINNSSLGTPLISSGTIQNAVINSPIVDLPNITGGTATSQVIRTPVIGTPSIISGTANNLTIGTPSITGGTTSNQTINLATIGTPDINSGTITNAFIKTPNIGTPTVSGGTIAGATIINSIIGTPAISGGTLTSSVINSATLGTPTVTGGSFTSATINNSTIGTPAITGGTMNSTLIGTIAQGSDAAGDIYYRASNGLFTRLGIGGTGQVLIVSSGTLPSWGTTSGGSGTALALSAITAATGANTISNSNYTQTWNWLLNSTTNGIEFGETSAGTGTGYILSVSTKTTSTAKPFQIKSRDVDVFNVSAAGSITVGATMYMSNQAISGVYSMQQYTSSNWKFDNSGTGYVAGKFGVAAGTSGFGGLIHIGSGGTAANSAPIKLTSGYLLTTPEPGAIEYDGTAVYMTNSGSIRSNLARTNYETFGTPSITGGTITNTYLVGVDLGIPSSLDLTNATGLPVSTGITGLGAGIATFLATPSSLNLWTSITDPTGSGKSVFSSNPLFNTKIRIGSASSATGIIELNGSTSGVVSMTTADAAGTWTMQLPTSGGTSGHFLTTNGSGVTSWAAVPTIARSVSAIATNTAAGADALTDYVYLASGTPIVTLPTAAGNANRYTIKNTGSGAVTIATTSSQTIDGNTTFSVLPGVSVDVLANGSSWYVDSGYAAIGTTVSTFLATPSSANLAAAVTDETGSGALVFATSPTFTTSIVTPLIIGGSGTASDLFLQTTSGVGTTGADMHFLVGNNGATEAMTILNSAKVGIGVTAPPSRLSVVESGTVISPAATTVGLFQRSTATSSNSCISIISGNAATNSGINIGDTDNETVAGIQYNHSTNAMTLLANAGIRITINSSGYVGIGKSPSSTSGLSLANIPTSASGLSAGDVYSLSGVLMIV